MPGRVSDFGVPSKVGKEARMDRKFVGGIIVAVGVVLLIISALADPIGLVTEMASGGSKGPE
jgi:hypothetical protein